MLDWANPGALGTLKEWTKYVSKPLGIGQSKNSKDVERIRAKVGPASFAGLINTCKPIMQKVAIILKDKLLPQYFKRRYVRIPTIHTPADLAR